MHRSLQAANMTCDNMKDEEDANDDFVYSYDSDSDDE